MIILIDVFVKYKKPIILIGFLKVLTMVFINLITPILTICLRKVILIHLGFRNHEVSGSVQ